MYEDVERLGYVPNDVTVVWEVKDNELNPELEGYRKTCEYRKCGKEFIAPTKRRKYCCDEHKIAEYHERKADKKEVSHG